MITTDLGAWDGLRLVSREGASEWSNGDVKASVSWNDQTMRFVDVVESDVITPLQLVDYGPVAEYWVAPLNSSKVVITGEESARFSIVDLASRKAFAFDAMKRFPNEVGGMCYTRFHRIESQFFIFWELGVLAISPSTGSLLWQRRLPWNHDVFGVDSKSLLVRDLYEPRGVENGHYSIMVDTATGQTVDVA